MKAICFLLFIVFYLYSNAQFGNNIYNIYAFFSVQGKGTIFIDPDEKVIDRRGSSDTLYTIYIETGSKAPLWQSAYRGGKVYSVKNVLIEKLPFEVGTDHLHHRKIILKAAEHNQLWRLVLLPEGDSKLKYPARNKEIILFGKYRKKNISLHVTRVIQLYSPDRP